MKQHGNRQGIRRSKTAALWPRRGFAFCLGALLLAAIVGSSSAFGQASGGTDADAVKSDEDSSRRVDESEESYRTRMELRDQRYREQKRADMTYSSQIGTSKLDQLPEASREHIKEQMRDMIIASRQWKPGEDVSDYPYVPSAAAQTDPELRRRERDAWAEQLEKYQEREAAAYANAQGQQNGQADGRESGKDSGGAGKGEGANKGARASAAGQNQADSSRAAESYTERERQEEPVSTAGVSESALSFLQSRSGRTGAAEIQAGDAKSAGAGGDAAEESPAASENDNGAAPAGSLAVSELAQLQGMTMAPDGGQQGSSTALPTGSKDSSASKKTSPEQPSGETSEQDERAEVLAGTLKIDELENLGAMPAPETGSAESGKQGTEMQIPAPAARVEPGTLDIDDLKRLGANDQN